MVFPDVWRPLASARIEDRDTRRLFGRLLGWAAMAVVDDLEVGREKRARCSVNLNFIPLGFSYVLVVSLSSSVPTSVLPFWENKPLVYCGGEGKKSRDWAGPEGTPRSNCASYRDLHPVFLLWTHLYPCLHRSLFVSLWGVLTCELACFLVFLTVLCFLFQNCVSVASSIIFVLSDLYLKQTFIMNFLGLNGDKYMCSVPHL